MSADHRRRRLVIAAAASPFAGSIAHAQSWPSRQIRIVCPIPPGGFAAICTLD